MAHRRHRAPREFPRVELTLEGISHLGGTVARLDDLVHFVSYGLPGEFVRAEIVDHKPTYQRAGVLEVLGNASPDRITAPCEYFGRCGGCAWQHAIYERQLEFKTGIVRDQLRRVGGFEDPPLRPIIPATSPYGYRNHARFSTRRDGTLGFTREHTHAVMTIDHCHTIMPAIGEMLAALQGHCPRMHQVAIRHSVWTGESLISPRIPDAPIATGQTHLHEMILGRRFRIAANSFFQVNTLPHRRALPDQIAARWITQRDGEWSQTDILALVALDRLAPSAGETYLDAYCGVGTFALLIADRIGTSGHTIGIEEAVIAVNDARHNAADTPGIEFLQGKVEKLLPDLDLSPDGAILDPARAGCDRPTIDALINRRVRRIVYVSCDPATLARDLRIFVDAGYHLTDVQPIDMFPQTHHIETVATLER